MPAERLELRDTIRGMRNRVLLWLIPAAVVLAGLVVVLLFAQPAAPKVIDLFAGPKGTTYYAYAERYAAFLAKRGVTVRIRKTQGSIENLQLLAQEEVPAAAFALSGVDKRMQGVEGIEELESLGCLSFQPFWMFVREGSDLESTQDLVGRRVALGQSETDTRAIASLALAANDVGNQVVEATIEDQTPRGMVEALTQGEVDAVFLVGLPQSPGVSAFLESELIEAVSFERIDAYTRLHPEVGQVTIPQGLYALGRNIPESDLRLVSPADNLVIRSDLHPVMVDLLLDAARFVHREPSLFGDRGTFPNMRHTSLPVAEAAVRFYEQGPPAWRKYLPYWLATLISRFALIVAQVGAVVLLVLRGIPAAFRARFKVKTTRFYKRMEELESELMAGAGWEESKAEFEGLHGEIASLKVPRFMLTDYLELRQNLHDLRERMAVWHEDHPDAAAD